jgi:Flp pilus assembly protein TadD
MLTSAGRLWLLLIALAIAAPLFAQEVEEAERLFRAGQHQQALERVNRFLSSNPRDAKGRFLKGVILTEQGKTKDAIEIFTRLTQDRPELPEPYNNLAVLYASQGQYEKARVALEQSIRTHPSYATAYENLGDVYAKLASQAYDKALQIDSSNQAAKNKLALVRELGGRPTQVAAAPKDAPKEAPKPMAEKPKPAPEKPAPVADASSEVMKAVNGWAEAWSNKDADAYLAFYAKDFKTPRGESRAEWEKVRRSRIAAPKSISVAIASAKVTMDGANRATVSFRQNYRSDVLKSNSRKTLVLVRTDGRWQIVEEKSG